MPDDKKHVGDDIDQYQKDQDEFASAVEDIFADEAKSDADILAGSSEPATGDEGGIPDKDLPAAADSTSEGEASSLFNDGQGVTNPETKPDDTEIDWKKKADEAGAELKKEQQKTSSWNGRITKANERVKALEAEIEQLKLTKAADVDPDKESDKEVLDRFRTDFPELASVVDVLDKRISGITPAKVEPEKQDATPEPTDAATEEDQEPTTHYTDVRKAHPEIDEIINQGVLLTWINGQADFIKSHLETIFYKGNTKQVIDMVQEFKTKSGWKSQLRTGSNKTSDKLESMKEVNSESPGPTNDGPDKNDFEGAAKEAGL